MSDGPGCKVCAAGDEVEVDIEKDVLTQLSTGKTFPLKPLGEVIFIPALAYGCCFS